MVTGSNFAESAALYSKLPYDPVKDFSGITQIASTPLVLVVAPTLGAKSVKELIALAREKPGQLNYGSTGLGSGPHYGGELFKLASGVNAVHVPTVAEAGLAGFEYQGWYGMLAPSRTPRAIINLLAKEMGQILELSDIKERIASQGAVAKSSTPDAFDKLVHDEITTRRKVWKAAGVKAE
jgi:tripartite-type tricarboxylate transporter receptor subunit TctC